MKRLLFALFGKKNKNQIDDLEKKSGQRYSQQIDDLEKESSQKYSQQVKKDFTLIKIRKQIKKDNSHTYNECVRSYLKIFENTGTSSSVFQNFILILQEKGLYEENKIDELRYELEHKKIANKITHDEEKELFEQKKQDSENFIQLSNKEELIGTHVLSNSRFEKAVYMIAKKKGIAFFKSREYIFIQKAVAREKLDGFINYDLLDSLIRNKWKFSKKQLFEFVSLEKKENNLGGEEKELRGRKEKNSVRTFSKMISDKLNIKNYEFERYRQQYDKSLPNNRDSNILNNSQHDYSHTDAELLLDDKENNFVISSAYNYIKQFAKKYSEKGKSEDFNQLQNLLKNWQWEFSIDELKTFVLEENKKQKIENLKFKILISNPHNRSAILKAYLNFYRSNDQVKLEVLAELLEERYSTSENTSNLKGELQTIEKRIELENFEKRLLEEDEQIQLEEIDGLNGYEFEDFLKNLFSKMGYQVEQTKLSGDQGADLVVIKFGEKSVIQAKRFGGKVGNKAVQEIMAAISLYKAQKGIVITNNYFTSAAVELANANNIKLIDRDALEELIDKYW